MAFAAVMAIMSISQGAQKNAALRAEASRIEEQGDIALQENREAADMMAVSNRQFEDKQTLAYIKNGVSLEGSPMLVLEETRRVGREEVAAFRAQGRARFNLSVDKAIQLRDQGRAAVTGSVIQAGVGIAGSGGSKAKDTTKAKPKSDVGSASNVDAADRFWSRTGTV